MLQAKTRREHTAVARKPGDKALPPRRRGRISKPLGPIAFLIMQIVVYLTDKYGAAYASGMQIERELSELFGETADLSQVYVTLGRLEEDRGFLRAETVASPHAEGYKVKAYAITPAGREAMIASEKFYAIVASPYVQLGVQPDAQTKLGKTKRRGGA